MRSLAVGALALVIAMADTAVADPETVGIVAVGNKKLTAPVKDHIASWLGQRGHEVKEGALPAGAIKTLTDCIVIDDLRSCASGVVEAQAKTDSVIYVEIRSETAKQDKELTLVLHWFAKQRVPASERRICEECTDDTLTGTLDAMLSSLETSAVASGHVKVTSKPVGLLVLIDNAALGVTPVERDVRAGRHEFTLVRDGKTVATETAKIEPGASVELTMTPTGVDESGRHLRKRVIPRSTKIRPGRVRSSATPASSARGCSWAVRRSRPAVPRSGCSVGARARLRWSPLVPVGPRSCGRAAFDRSCTSRGVARIVVASSARRSDPERDALARSRGPPV
jgi:hypothetical protein